MMSSTVIPAFDLEKAAKVHKNLSTDQLIEMALAREEGTLASNGAFVSRTGKYTGRTPKDKYVVRDSQTEDKVWWDNNTPMEPSTFEKSDTRSAGRNRPRSGLTCFRSSSYETAYSSSAAFCLRL